MTPEKDGHIRKQKIDSGTAEATRLVFNRRRIGHVLGGRKKRNQREAKGRAKGSPARLKGKKKKG